MGRNQRRGRLTELRLLESIWGNAFDEALQFARACGVSDRAVQVVIEQPGTTRTRREWADAMGYTNRFLRSHISPHTQSFACDLRGVVPSGPHTGVEIMPLLQHQDGPHCWGYDESRNQTVVARLSGQQVDGCLVRGRRVLSLGYEMSGRVWVSPDGEFTDKFVMKPLPPVFQQLFTAMQTMALRKLRGQHISAVTPCWPAAHPDHVPDPGKRVTLIHEIMTLGSKSFGVLFHHEYLPPDASGDYPADVVGRHVILERTDGRRLPR